MKPATTILRISLLIMIGHLSLSIDESCNATKWLEDIRISVDKEALTPRQKAEMSSFQDTKNNGNILMSCSRLRKSHKLIVGSTEFDTSRYSIEHKVNDQENKSRQILDKPKSKVVEKAIKNGTKKSLTEKNKESKQERKVEKNEKLILKTKSDGTVNSRGKNSILNKKDRSNENKNDNMNEIKDNDSSQLINEESNVKINEGKERHDNNDIVKVDNETEKILNENDNRNKDTLNKDSVKIEIESVKITEEYKTKMIKKKGKEKLMDNTFKKKKNEIHGQTISDKKEKQKISEKMTEKYDDVERRGESQFKNIKSDKGKQIKQNNLGEKNKRIYDDNSNRNIEKNRNILSIIENAEYKESVIKSTGKNNNKILLKKISNNINEENDENVVLKKEDRNNFRENYEEKENSYEDIRKRDVNEDKISKNRDKRDENKKEENREYNEDFGIQSLNSEEAEITDIDGEKDSKNDVENKFKINLKSDSNDDEKISVIKVQDEDGKNDDQDDDSESYSEDNEEMKKSDIEDQSHKVDENKERDVEFDGEIIENEYRRENTKVSTKLTKYYCDAELEAIFFKYYVKYGIENNVNESANEDVVEMKRKENTDTINNDDDDDKKDNETADKTVYSNNDSKNDSMGVLEDNNKINHERSQWKVNKELRMKNQKLDEKSTEIVDSDLSSKHYENDERKEKSIEGDNVKKNKESKTTKNNKKNLSRDGKKKKTNKRDAYTEIDKDRLKSSKKIIKDGNKKNVAEKDGLDNNYDKTKVKDDKNNIETNVNIGNITEIEDEKNVRRDTMVKKENDVKPREHTRNDKGTESIELDEKLEDEEKSKNIIKELRKKETLSIDHRKSTKGDKLKDKVKLPSASGEQSISLDSVYDSTELFNSATNNGDGKLKSKEDNVIVKKSKIIGNRKNQLNVNTNKVRFGDVQSKKIDKKIPGNLEKENIKISIQTENEKHNMNVKGAGKQKEVNSDIGDKNNEKNIVKTAEIIYELKEDDETESYTLIGTKASENVTNSDVKTTKEINPAMGPEVKEVPPTNDMVTSFEVRLKKLIEGNNEVITKINKEHNQQFDKINLRLLSLENKMSYFHKLHRQSLKREKSMFDLKKKIQKLKSKIKRLNFMLFNVKSLCNSIRNNNSALINDYMVKAASEALNNNEQMMKTVNRTINDKVANLSQETFTKVLKHLSQYRYHMDTDIDDRLLMNYESAWCRFMKIVQIPTCCTQKYVPESNQRIKNVATKRTEEFNLKDCNNVQSDKIISKDLQLGRSTFKTKLLCRNKSVVMLQRMSRNINFTRNWIDYKYGFGELDDSFWIGLEVLYQLTNSDTYRLLISIKDWDNKLYNGVYELFKVHSERDGYQLKIGNYHGDCGDGLSAHDKSKFSTIDVDNDDAVVKFGGSCSNRFRGGWWYYSCYKCNPTGVYYDHGKVDSDRFDGISWKPLRPPTYSFQQIVMSIQKI